MLTVVKVRVFTDDHELPLRLRQRLEDVLREHQQEDPEGEEHAHIALEWVAHVHPRSYMEGLMKGVTTIRMIEPRARQNPVTKPRAPRATTRTTSAKGAAGRTATASARKART